MIWYTLILLYSYYCHCHCHCYCDRCCCCYCYCYCCSSYYFYYLGLKRYKETRTRIINVSDKCLYAFSMFWKGGSVLDYRENFDIFFLTNVNLQWRRWFKNSKYAFYIVAFAFLLLWDNLLQNSCNRFCVVHTVPNPTQLSFPARLID